MKNRKKNLMSLLKAGLFALVAIACINMGGGAEVTTGAEPQPTELEDDQANLVATIFDNNTQTKVEALSFSGKTTLGGIRRETDSAFIEINLASTKGLNIVQKNYISNKFGEKEFIKVDRQLLDDTWQKGLLFPKNTILSGYKSRRNAAEEGTGYSWFLREINKVVIDGRKNLLGGVN